MNWEKIICFFRKHRWYVMGLEFGSNFTEVSITDKSYRECIRCHTKEDIEIPNLSGKNMGMIETPKLPNSLRVYYKRDENGKLIQEKKEYYQDDTL